MIRNKKILKLISNRTALKTQYKIHKTMSKKNSHFNKISMIQICFNQINKLFSPLKNKKNMIYPRFLKI